MRRPSTSSFLDYSNLSDLSSPFSQFHPITSIYTFLLYDEEFLCMPGKNQRLTISTTQRITSTGENQDPGAANART